MRVATLRRDGGTVAARIEDDVAVVLPFRDVRELLESGADWRDAASGSGERLTFSEQDVAPLVPSPDKIIAVGLNDRAHAAEANLEVPDYPPLFSKYSASLIGARDGIRLPRNSTQVDWEVELCVVIGTPVRYGDEEAAAAAIAGYTISNDISMRDWQTRTSQWLQGKTFEASTPVGPYLLTLDEFDDPSALELTCDVDGKRRQTLNVSEMVFSPAEVVAYASQFITLLPGDLILMGTGAGVAFGMEQPDYLKEGSVVTTGITGFGELVNRCVAEDA